ncbi:TVP38/TMEM64 family protein [Cytobacillus gottheilii]|uniref:TVP38/TMEM64 family protein n=1 Tax=Cytobacillus gottheilii TaxID=859144 RepID=UPI00249419CA|nr:VTT domain-containing protein [Cytobacillus gottheilii]
MENPLLNWFPDNLSLTALISMGLNILIAVTGLLPSTFITFGTIEILGFKTGLIILIAGEAAGAIVSFILYRKGLFRLLSTYPKINNIENKFLRRLRKNEGIDAFFTVILLRVLPFVPSGAVTLTAALSKMGLYSFFFASTLGKIPALFIEAYSIAYVLDLNSEWQIGFMIFVAALFLFYTLCKSIKRGCP